MKSLLVSSLLILPFLSIAQPFSGGIALKGGMSYVAYPPPFYYAVSGIVDLQSKNKWQLCWQGGVFGMYRLTSRFALEAELLYAQQNGMIKSTFNSVDVSIESNISGTNKNYIKISYLSVPIFGSYFIPHSNFIISAGEQSSIKLSVKSMTVDDITVNGLQSHSEASIVSPNIKNMDFGVLAKVGYSINRQFQVNLEYYHGMISVVKNNPEDFNGRNQTLLFEARWNFLSKSDTHK